MTLNGQNRTIGSIACRVRGHAVDIGYAVARAYWREGYTTEAGRPVMAWTAELPKVYRVWAVCDCDNTASARVLEKLGMSREGLPRRWIIRRGNGVATPGARLALSPRAAYGKVSPTHATR